MYIEKIKFTQNSEKFKRTWENWERSGSIHITPWSLTLTATRLGKTADLKQVWGLLKECLAGHPLAKVCPRPEVAAGIQHLCSTDSTLTGHCSKHIVSICWVHSVWTSTQAWEGGRDVLTGTRHPNLRSFKLKKGTSLETEARMCRGLPGWNS